MVAEVFETSEGLLWEARVEGPDPYDVEFRKMGLPATEKTKLPHQLNAHHVWLDEAKDDLIARCKRHGRAPVAVTALREALERGDQRAQIRGGRVILG